jgi:hypothetical protein
MGPSSHSFSLARDAWGKLLLSNGAAGGPIPVVPVRAFPFSAPRQGVILCDAAGRELAWIDNLDTLPAEPRNMIEDELARREFVPLIRRIHRVSPRVEPSEWDVETDRGRARFVLNSADDVRRLDDVRAMVIDAHGIRYLIPSLVALDHTSRRILERYL